MAVTTVTSGLNQVKGINYTVITDTSADWPSVGNDVYFYDKATSLPYYKNAGGTVVSIFEEGGVSSNVYTADGTVSAAREVNLDNKKLTFDVGTLASGVNSNLGIEIDGSNIFYGGGGTSSPLLLVKGDLGQVLNVNSGGYLVSTSDYSSAIAQFRNRTNTKGLSIQTGITQLASTTFRINPDVTSTTTGVIIDVGSSLQQISLQQGGTISHWLRSGDSAAQASFFVNGFSGRGFNVGAGLPIGTEDISLQGDTLISKKLELSTTTDGFLMPRLTTAQKNAIPSPVDTNLMVFDTDLNSLQRYNGTAWVALAAGYGVVGVLRDSDNGNPTYFSDLQSALDTCKTAGSYNTVTLYGNVTTTLGIIIDATFSYKELTINFNGFKIENTQADTTHCLSSNPSNVSSDTILLDGSLIRENGTTGVCLSTATSGAKSIRMSKMYMFNENYRTTWIGGQHDYDFGGSIFESGTGNTTQSTLQLGYGNFRNFTTISNSSISSLFVVNAADVAHFIAKNASTGAGVTTQTGCIASNFYVETISGNAVSGGVLSNFVAKSASGIAVKLSGTSSAHNFVATTGNNYAIDVAVCETSNFRAENNSSTLPCVNLVNTLQCVQGYAKNLGGGEGLKIFRNQPDRSFSYNRITAISEGGIGAVLSSNSGFKVLLSNCEFVSKWNDVGGHSVQIGGNDTILTNCSLRVNNIGANNIMASSAITAKVANSTFDGATTPINSNITLNYLEADAYGNVTT